MNMFSKVDRNESKHKYGGKKLRETVGGKRIFFKL